MRLDRTPHFLRAYHKAPKQIQAAFDKQVRILLEDLHHPSLRAKKYDEAKDIWQARVNDDWRFYFKIVDDTYRMEEIRRHPK
jgi:mRNA-degrading endonuclease RelE of RelBE toxin-antitoxin system